MAERPKSNCECQKQAEAGKKGQQLGLDELMIVNPGPIAGGGAVFLGEDGTLYQVKGIGVEADPGELFLGDDGMLYQVQGGEAEGPVEGTTIQGLRDAKGQEFGRYFLGEDGMLYEIEDE
jgi:hypothetical protein